MGLDGALMGGEDAVDEGWIPSECERGWEVLEREEMMGGAEEERGLVRWLVLEWGGEVAGVVGDEEEWGEKQKRWERSVLRSGEGGESWGEVPADSGRGCCAAGTCPSNSSKSCNEISCILLLFFCLLLLP